MGRPSGHILAVRLLLLVLASCLPGAAARAVVISHPDGSMNTEFLAFNGWHYVGEVNGLTATYLGDGWVLTAGHVGPGDLTLGGVVYPHLPGWDTSFDNEGGPGSPDLLMFQVMPRPPLAPLALRSSMPTIGEVLVMIGCGRDRGAWTTYDPNGQFPPDPIGGWMWESSQTKRWGTNEVDGFPVGLVNGTVSFYTSFDDAGGHPFEAQGADGDSGGAVFTFSEGTQLAGVLYTIAPAIGQPDETSMFTNLTFAARVDFYYDQIQDAMAMPEPATGTGLGAGTLLLGLLGRRRRRVRRGAP
ncbi:MAG: hypothetical protein ACQGVC_17570 [Myxococcota bacterium]